jgi:hypothetical protein
MSDHFTPGDILARRIGGIRALWHFGILVAPDEVVHVSKERQAVILTSFDDFAAEGEVKKALYIAASDREATIARALSAIGERQYDLLDNNCEKFAIWCATGEEDCGLQARLAKFVGDIISIPAKVREERRQEEARIQEILGKAREDLRRAGEEAKARRDALQIQLDEFVRQGEEADRAFLARMQELRDNAAKERSP